MKRVGMESIPQERIVNSVFLVNYGMGSMCQESNRYYFEIWIGVGGQKELRIV